LNTTIIQDKINNEEFINSISDLLTGRDFGWYWNENTINKGSYHSQIGGFTHCFYTQTTSVNSNYFPIITSLLDKLKDKVTVEFIHRAQANFLCNIHVSKEEYENLIHADISDNNYISILYYVISSDGNTVIYDNEGFSTSVSPIKGNYVIFPSNFLHKATPPVDNKKRIVINIIVKGKLKE
jgi:hypothetical protein